MHTLYILRHAKSDWSVADLPDRERPLKKRGRRDAERIGVYLAQQNIMLDRILVSPALRARETLTRMLKAKNQPFPHVDIIGDLYMTSVKQHLEIISKQDNDLASLMLIGHNPALELLLETLLGKTFDLPGNDRQKKLPTATLVQLNVPCAWKDIATGRLTHIRSIFARQLPRTFPYPDNFGSEQRIRPAYYYFQSSILPYRHHNGDLQVLMVRSSQGRHFIVPKGVIEPGMSARDSAIKEAREEAGIEGLTSERSIARYTLTKWAGHCEVVLYLMKVERILEPPDWSEPQRGRSWLHYKDAAGLVKNRNLATIIRQLPQWVAEFETETVV